MSLRLIITAVLDVYEAVEATRLDLATRYEIALHAGDELEIRRVEALASDYDLRNPGAGVLGDLYPVAA